MIWQPKLFLYEGNNFNHQNHLEIINQGYVPFFMNSSSSHYYGLSMVYSNQHKFIILLHKIMIKMYIDDDKQKEKTIIPSLGGVKDLFVSRSSCFQLLNLKTWSLLKKGSSFVALVQKGSIFDDSILDPWCFSPGFLVAFS